MQFYSLNSPQSFVSFREATIRGQAPDKGLYFPSTIPRVSESLIKNIGSLSKEEIAFDVIQPYISTDIPEEILKNIVAQTVNFEFPLVKLNDQISTLELFHGPTLAFKDVGARFMSRCLGYFVQDNNQELTVLVATSGDTGGAVANGFYDVPGIRVIILYPAGKVSNVQELQLTTLGKNIHALEVSGTFDDCQQMVKEAFADEALNKEMFLTSANSINVARWLPQQFYYFYLWQQWADKKNPPVVSVPSGNFGNICAGLLALRSGLPVDHFIAACNANDIVPSFLQTGKYTPKPAVATLSNAMDVGNPSNFVRILELFDKEINPLKKILSSYSITDEETRNTIRQVYEQDKYIADPHGAVGYLALQRYLEIHSGNKGVFLETAHPVKFFDAVEPVIGTNIPLPQSVQDLFQLHKEKTRIESNYSRFKDYLVDTN